MKEERTKEQIKESTQFRAMVTGDPIVIEQWTVYGWSADEADDFYKKYGMLPFFSKSPESAFREDMMDSYNNVAFLLSDYKNGKR